MDMDEPNEASKAKLAIPDAIMRLRQVRKELEMLVANLHENIQALDDDPDFQDSFELTRQNAQQKAARLEAEVKQLRIDIETIKNLLGDDNEEGNL